MRVLLVLSLLLGVATTVQAQSMVSPRDAAHSVALLRATPREAAAQPLADRPNVGQRRRGSLAGGIGGFVVGAAVGGVVGCALNNDDYGAFCGGQNDTKVVVSALLGGALGAWLGARLLARSD